MQFTTRRKRTLARRFELKSSTHLFVWEEGVREGKETGVDVPCSHRCSIAYG